MRPDDSGRAVRARTAPLGARRLAGALAFLLVAAGVGAAVLGLVRWLAPLTDRTGEVAVPVQVTSSDGVGADLLLLVGLEPYEGVGVSGVATGGLPHTDHRTYPLGVVTIHAPDASASEKLLSRADSVIRGLALLAGAIALRPVLGAISDGRPFRRRDERGLRVVALCVVVGAYVAPLVPWRASAVVLARLDGAHGLSATPVHHLEVFVVAALVVLVGVVVRMATPEPTDRAQT